MSADESRRQGNNEDYLPREVFEGLMLLISALPEKEERRHFHGLVLEGLTLVTRALQTYSHDKRVMRNIQVELLRKNPN